MNHATMIIQTIFALALNHLIVPLPLMLKKSSSNHKSPRLKKPKSKT